ncbi:hypothetical protein [Pseudomonas matsuisoli]|uniref:Uncharacterized protein n=1 Tax=Pseudomonas matsuisoli TaxID=1515666 RepID=A0A917PN78_9PSED|nr:hypothetical protein [Pseudomonas matsuisoli]GGJ85823.1 hypothetical protein GCM10009304_09880 [Pseudomonas matsuisoli]
MNANWLDRLHTLTRQRERIAEASLARHLRAFEKARQADQTLQTWASARRLELEGERDQAWQQFVGKPIDFAGVVAQQTREATQTLELEGIDEQQRLAAEALKDADTHRQTSLRAHAKVLRRLSALQTLADHEGRQAEQRAQFLAEEDQPLPVVLWKDRH